MIKEYSAIGTIRYAKHSGWIVLDCPDSIVWYYKSWVEKFTWKKASTPLHGSHVTVLAGKYEKPRKPENWNKYQGEKVHFYYSPTIYTDDKYFWLRVYCPFLVKVRRSLGLSDTPKWMYHLTICYINY